MTLGEHVPTGMRLGDYSQHPVTAMIRLVGAYGARALPSKTELDSLKLGPRDRKALEVALNDVAELRDDPDHNPAELSARELAEQRAGEVVGGLPDEQKDRAWFERSEEDLSTLGPAETRRPRQGARGRLGMSLYQDTDEAQRGAARRKVSQAAHEGRAPSAHFPASDLEWAFDGHEGHLAELEQVAKQKRQREIERDRLAARRSAVDATAEQLLKKWEEDEQREKRSRAFAEAERIVAEREAGKP